MAETIQKVLDIKVEYEKAIKGIAQYEAQIREARAAQREFREELKYGVISQEEYDEKMAASKAVITQLKQEQAVLTKQVQQSVKAQNAAANSLVQLRAKLSNLTAEYDALSGEMRNGDVGKALQAQINEVTDQLKGAEEETQRYYRNVGNYENSVRAALESMNEEIKKANAAYKEAVETQGEMSDAAQEAKQHLEGLQYVMDFTTESSNKLMASIIPFGDKIIPLLGNGLKGVKQAFTLAGQGAQILGKQLLALMANPIVAFLGLVAAALTIVINGIKGSEENMNQWNKIMAPVNRALTGLRNVIEILCGWILNVVEAGGRLLYVLGNILEWATSSIPIVGDAIHGAMEATREAIELEEREQQLAKDRRENIVEEAKLQQEIAKLRNEAADASNKDTNARLAASKKAMELELKIAAEKKRLAQEELAIARAKAEQAGNSAADNEELARLEAAVYNAETEYYKNTKRLQSEQNALEKSIADERKKRAEDAKKQTEERIKAAKELSATELAAVRAAEDALLQLVEDAAEQRRQQINLQYSRQIEDLKKRLDEEKKLTAVARNAINQQIAALEKRKDQELDALNKEAIDKEIERRKKLIEARLSAVEKGTEEEYNLRLQQLQMQEDAELAMYENDAEMKLAIQEKYNQSRLILANEAEENYKAILQKELDEHTRIIEQENKIEQARYDMAASVTGGIKDVFASLGESNKAFAKMSKVLALAEIAINTGKALAAGIAQSQSVPYPANLAAIATTVASVLSGVASAISTVKSAKFARGGKVEERAGGGKIVGAGTGTSDSIPAWLSNGEFVMTAAATKMFEPTLQAMNAIGQGVSPQLAQQAYLAPSTTNLLSDSIAASMAEVRPVVSVVDINNGINRVEVIDNLDAI